MWRVLLLAIALAGCASTPQATRERDAEAKRFESRPDAAAIYVYRDAVGPEDDGSNDPVLFVDRRLLGAVLPGTFFRFDVRAGAHELRAASHSQATLKLDARYGELYFVSLTMTAGVPALRRVEPETGRRDILRCCALLENWAPGQSPFLW